MARKVDQAKVSVVRKLCAGNLKFLCHEILGMRDWSGNPRCHDDLDAFLRKPERKKLILMPRKHLKSSFVTVAYVILRILNDPNIRILISSSTWDNSKTFLKVIKDYLTTKSLLPGIFGNFESGLWNTEMIEVAQRNKAFKEPTIATSGVEKALASQHYDLVIGDDLVERENAKTPDTRRKVKTFYKDILDLLENDGEVIIIGTRWHFDDLYSDLLEKPNWSVFLRRAIDQDGILYPEKFNNQILKELRSDKGTWEYSAQYMNNPIDVEDQTFKQSKFLYFEQAPRNLNVCMTIDPATESQNGLDNWGVIIAGMDEFEHLWIQEAVRFRRDLNSSVNEVMRLIKTWNPTRLGIETRMFQDLLKYHLVGAMQREGTYRPIVELGRGKRWHDSKINRINNLQPLFETGKVHIRRGLDDLEEELLEFPNGKHDDLIDALAYQLDIQYPARGVYQQVKSSQGTFNWWRSNAQNASKSAYETFLSDW